MTWDQIGRNTRKAAQLLKDADLRSCVSRSYYAAFSVLNQRLLRHERPPRLYETHSHRHIPDLIEVHLLPRNAQARRSLRTTVVRLYNARLDADYRLSRTVDQAVALNALRDVKSIFQVLGVSDA
ncbi:MAG TPA: HEPN domain-containing protein [Tepidisphaeraceae bacterium]|jgi:uncharacterized protein (UPF0332 family)|nr:HEPN domain-containing protein [Tepidisphaeraceae bacterium]